MERTTRELGRGGQGSRMVEGPHVAEKVGGGGREDESTISEMS